MSNDNNDPNDFSIIFEHDYQPELDMGEQVRYLVDSLVRHGAFLDEIIAECVFRLRRDDPELGTEEEAFYLTVAAEATRLCCGGGHDDNARSCFVVQMLVNKKPQNGKDTDIRGGKICALGSRGLFRAP
ncbi:hypothetical protein QBC44DRAFT_313159 [Cladorrhinum sp. PSN332]|nr:hypothetical protein QBC44DRAFT_313159 [Cladorrhinum sp. PSN332]